MSVAPESGDVLTGGLVVGIGASAGGLAAFKTFLSSTPSDGGMAFILVQHLDPHHKSLLVELLGAHAPIPVLEATDGMAVRKNCVFVIPPMPRSPSKMASSVWSLRLLRASFAAP